MSDINNDFENMMEPIGPDEGKNLTPADQNTAGMPSFSDPDFQKSMQDMQAKMESAYKELANQKVSGQSTDETLKVVMTASYAFVDLDFGKPALAGGISEFKVRIKEAWEDVTQKIQQVTQEQTLSLLKDMPMPQDMPNTEDNS